MSRNKKVYDLTFDSCHRPQIRHQILETSSFSQRNFTLSHKKVGNMRARSALNSGRVGPDFEFIIVTGGWEMEFNRFKVSHSNRRKAGRFSPQTSQGYTLYIDGISIKMEHLADIGPEGFKILHRNFKDFSPNHTYTVVFKRHNRELFTARAKFCWQRSFKYPVNMNLMGFQFDDQDFKLAHFWVQRGYRGKDFEVKERNDYRPMLRFHKVLYENSPKIFREGALEKLAAVLPEYGLPVFLLVLFISAVL